MESSQVAGSLRNMMRGEVRIGEPLARHVTLSVGGAADVMAFPLDVGELMSVLGFARGHGLPSAVMGHGSNVVVPDEGVRGLVINLLRMGRWVEFTDEEVRVGAGYPLSGLVRRTVGRGLAGLEGLAGVPGTVGGALFMNAGAAGQSIGDVTEAVEVATPQGNMVWLRADEMEFGYRSSRLQREDLVAVSVRLRLRAAGVDGLESSMGEAIRRRRETQPLDRPSAGSVFKNPAGDFAGRLSEAAGCKGMRVGGAEVSPRHANFIVNTGSATAADVLNLMALVYRRVKDEFGLKLEPEVRLFGRPQQELLLFLESGDVWSGPRRG